MSSNWCQIFYSVSVNTHQDLCDCQPGEVVTADTLAAHQGAEWTVPHGTDLNTSDTNTEEMMAQLRDKITRPSFVTTSLAF